MEYWNHLKFLFHQSGEDDFFAILGLVLAFAAYFPYLYAIATRQAKPATSAWFIWSLLSITILISAARVGKIFPQMIVYAVLDPVVLLIALYKRHNSPLEKEDYIALTLGIISCTAYYFLPYLALVCALIGITIGNIPIWKNIKKDPYVENLLSWKLFSLAGISSFLSSIVYYTKFVNILTPFTYMALCIISTHLIIVGRKK